jgi:hypothetical protein
MPRFSHDDVVDFLVTEAVISSAIEDEQEQQKVSEHQEQIAGHRKWAADNALLDG